VENLFRLLLLLLTDAYFELLNLGVLKSLVVMPCYRLGEILVHIALSGEDCHYGEIIVAGRAEGPEPLHIWNCHNFLSLSEITLPFAPDRW
jgi:hypothetical protein